MSTVSFALTERTFGDSFKQKEDSGKEADDNADVGEGKARGSDEKISFSQDSFCSASQTTSHLAGAKENEASFPSVQELLPTLSSLERMLEVEKARNEELIRENTKLQHSLQIKSMFVRYVSHEIRTPLNTVSMGLKLLNDDNRAAPSRRHRRPQQQPQRQEGLYRRGSAINEEEHDTEVQEGAEIIRAAASSLGASASSPPTTLEAAALNNHTTDEDQENEEDSEADDDRKESKHEYSIAEEYNEELASNGSSSYASFLSSPYLLSSSLAIQPHENDSSNLTTATTPRITTTNPCDKVAAKNDTSSTPTEKLDPARTHHVSQKATTVPPTTTASATAQAGNSAPEELSSSPSYSERTTLTIAAPPETKQSVRGRIQRKIADAGLRAGDVQEKKKRANGGSSVSSACSSSEPATPSLTHDLKESCNIAIDILNDLLLYEKLEGGLLQLEKSDEPALSTIAEAVKIFSMQAKQGSIDLQFTFDSRGFSDNELLDPSVFIHVDRPKLCQVLRNLVSNAIKFSPENSIVSVHLNMVTAEGTSALTGMKSVNDLLRGSIDFPPFLRVSVLDAGAGISPENQMKLFGSIVQFDAKKLQNGGGSGLGLYISKGIMDLHEGRIGVQSEGEGKGCCFYIDIPVEWRRESASADAVGDVTTSTSWYSVGGEASVAQSKKEGAHGISTSDSNDGSDNILNHLTEDKNVVDDGDVEKERRRVDDDTIIVSDERSGGGGRAGDSNNGRCIKDEEVEERGTNLNNREDTNTIGDDTEKVVTAMESMIDGLVDKKGVPSSQKGQQAMTAAAVAQRALNRAALGVGKSSTPDRRDSERGNQSNSKKDSRSRRLAHPTEPERSGAIRSGASTKAATRSSTPERILAISLRKVGRITSSVLAAPSSQRPRLSRRNTSREDDIDDDDFATVQLRRANNNNGKGSNSADATEEEDVVGEGGCYTTESGRLLTVLIVDDSKINRRMAAKILKASGVEEEIDEADDGQRALDKVIDSLLHSREGYPTGGKENEDSLFDSAKAAAVYRDTKKPHAFGDNDKLNVVSTTEMECNDGVGGKKNVRDSVAGLPPIYYAVLMDSVMPVMDGPTATRRMREAGYKGLIIGVTGNIQPEDIDYFISCGADTVMGKPIDVDLLSTILRDAKKKYAVAPARRRKTVSAAKNEEKTKRRAEISKPTDRKNAEKRSTKRKNSSIKPSASADAVTRPTHHAPRASLLVREAIETDEKEQSLRKTVRKRSSLLSLRAASKNEEEPRRSPRPQESSDAVIDKNKLFGNRFGNKSDSEQEGDEDATLALKDDEAEDNDHIFSGVYDSDSPSFPLRRYGRRRAGAADVGNHAEDVLLSRAENPIQSLPTELFGGSIVSEGSVGNLVSYYLNTNTPPKADRQPTGSGGLISHSSSPRGGGGSSSLRIVRSSTRLDKILEDRDLDEHRNAVAKWSDRDNCGASLPTGARDAHTPELGTRGDFISSWRRRGMKKEPLGAGPQQHERDEPTSPRPSAGDIGSFFADEIRRMEVEDGPIVLPNSFLDNDAKHSRGCCSSIATYVHYVFRNFGLRNSSKSAKENVERFADGKECTRRGGNQRPPGEDNLSFLLSRRVFAMLPIPSRKSSGAVAAETLPAAMVPAPPKKNHESDLAVLQGPAELSPATTSGNTASRRLTRSRLGASKVNNVFPESVVSERALQRRIIELDKEFPLSNQHSRANDSSVGAAAVARRIPWLTKRGATRAAQQSSALSSPVSSVGAGGYFASYPKFFPSSFARRRRVAHHRGDDGKSDGDSSTHSLPWFARGAAAAAGFENNSSRNLLIAAPTAAPTATAAPLGEYRAHD